MIYDKPNQYCVTLNGHRIGWPCETEGDFVRYFLLNGKECLQWAPGRPVIVHMHGDVQVKKLEGIF
jgi:hypothetical protein